MNIHRSPVPHLLLVLLLVSVFSGCSRLAPAVGSETAVRPVFVPPPTADPAWDWSSSTPEGQGMDSEALVQLLNAIADRQLDLDSWLVIRNGQIVMEVYFYPSTQTAKHEIYSCTKSFTSTLVGIAIERGYIQGVDQPVLDNLLPRQEFANLDDRKSALQLEDLLTMTSGLDWQEGDSTYRQMYQSNDWVAYVLDIPMQTNPGVEFNYCSGCSHILSAIVGQQTGLSTQEFARQALFEPIGLRSVAWDQDAGGNPIGGWGLKLTAREMARLGYLFLNQGAWDGSQIVSAHWVQTATQAHIATGGELGYGYQWWIYPRHGAYAALGRDGQTIFVDPELNLVVVTQAQIADHDPIFRLLEEFVFPAARSTATLPANPAAQAQLEALSIAAGQP